MGTHTTNKKTNKWTKPYIEAACCLKTLKRCFFGQCNRLTSSFWHFTLKFSFRNNCFLGFAKDKFKDSIWIKMRKHFWGWCNCTTGTIKITRRTTGARGCKFLLFQSIFNYFEQFSWSILVYLGLSRFIFVFLDYLGVLVHTVYLRVS